MKGARKNGEYGEPLGEFHYGQVRFEDGPHQRQLTETLSVLQGMSEESLLRPFRARAGFDAPGVELGGWYSSDSFVPGHSFGQWLSALSRYHAISGDRDVREKVDRLVRGFAATIEPSGKFYKGYEHAAYTYDLLAGGLIDAHRYAGLPSALKVLAEATAAAVPYLGAQANEMRLDRRGAPEEHLMDHNYVIPEHQFIAGELSGDERHDELARRYLLDGFFDPLAAGRNALPGLHAYTHVNALSSAAKAYLVLGDQKYLQAAKNGFDLISAQSYATGAWGPHEYFLPSPGYPVYKFPEIRTLGESLTKTRRSFETPCCAYAHFKLARYLLRITQDPKYGDSLERVMYNTVLGAKPLQRDGRAFYYSDYSAGARKTYFEGAPGYSAEWPCCSGSLPQAAADYRICAFFRDGAGVFVNLYIPSTLRWRQAGADVALTQSGAYPLADWVTMGVTASAPSSFTLRFRIPAWARAPSISINGTRFEGEVRPGTFVSIHREWQSGDRIELELPRSLELQPIDAEHPDLVALVCGPLVLFAIGAELPRATRSALLEAVQGRDGGAEWAADIAGRRVQFLPWMQIMDEPYTTYLTVQPNLRSA